MNLIECTSCGSRNTLPEGKNAMFCAYCGGAIERKADITKQNTSILTKPKITKKGNLSITNREIKTVKEVFDWFTDEGLSDIKKLDLSNNQITDVSGLEKLIHLEELNLSDNPITNLTAFPRIEKGDNDWMGLNIYLNNTLIHDVSEDVIDNIKYSAKNRKDLYFHLENTSSNWVIEILNVLSEYKAFKGSINFFTNDDLTSFKWSEYKLKSSTQGTSRYTYSTLPSKSTNTLKCTSCSAIMTTEMNNNGICVKCIEEKKNTKFWAIAHFISPLFIAYFLNKYFTDDDSDFMTSLGMGLLIVIVLFIGITSNSTKNVKTGKSFQTKSGLKLDEYQEQTTYAPIFKSIHYIIGFIHIIALVISIYLNIE